MLLYLHLFVTFFTYELLVPVFIRLLKCYYCFLKNVHLGILLLNLVKEKKVIL